MHVGTPVRGSPELTAVPFMRTQNLSGPVDLLMLDGSCLSSPPRGMVVCRHPRADDGYNSCGEKTVLFIRLVFSDGKAPDYCTEAQVADVMWTKGGSNPVHANAMFRASSCKFKS